MKLPGVHAGRKNEALQEKVAELQAELDAARAQNDDLQGRHAGLRRHAAALEEQVEDLADVKQVCAAVLYGTHICMSCGYQEAAGLPCGARIGGERSPVPSVCAALPLP